VILTSLDVDAAAFERRTGWSIKPEGACKGEVCVPLPDGPAPAPTFDVRPLADRLGMALVEDTGHGVWALGPEAIGGRALTTAALPDIVLPDLRTGDVFDVASLRGQKVLLLAWATW
jgi:hypothetical protein